MAATVKMKKGRQPGERLAYRPRGHGGKHHPRVDYTRGKGMAGRLVLSRCRLLHHKQGRPDEPKGAAEILKDYRRTNPRCLRGLKPGRRGINGKGNVGHRGQRGQRFARSAMAHIAAGQHRPCHECRRSIGAAIQTYLLVGRSPPPCARGDLRNRGTIFITNPSAKRYRMMKAM